MGPEGLHPLGGSHRHEQLVNPVGRLGEFCACQLTAEAAHQGPSWPGELQLGQELAKGRQQGVPGPIGGQGLHQLAPGRDQPNPIGQVHNPG